MVEASFHNILKPWKARKETGAIGVAGCIPKRYEEHKEWSKGDTPGIGTEGSSGGRGERLHMGGGGGGRDMVRMLRGQALQLVQRQQRQVAGHLRLEQLQA